MASTSPTTLPPPRPSTGWDGAPLLGRLAAVILWGLTLVAAPVSADPLLHHDLRVLLEPAEGKISVEDQLGLPLEGTDWTFSLHAGMAPRVSAVEATLSPLGAEGHLERFRLTLPEQGSPVTLSYGGRIRHGLDPVQESLGRQREWTRGIISADGVFLDGASGWYPRFEDRLIGFDLSVELPPGWLAVSQGAGPDPRRSEDSVTVRWRESQPQDDIYLMAGAFRLYEQATPIAPAQIYLRRADEGLANRYLEATGRYLDLYSRLIGPYPYAKFALVENFWATGYGMPSFTVLGAEVIRLPFIPTSSYPHEVLHNWWGNGVYVDYESGNWSEGLTSYLADHLLKEEAGQGAAYRRDSLQGYASYVQAEKDFPLTAFRGRHSAASQAVGYGKTLMLFHMLRRELGDETFVAGLRRFYGDNRFRTAGFAEVRRAFEAVSGRDLGPFFDQWTRRTGAPSLAIERVTRTPTETGYRIAGLVRQTQSAPPFALRIPLVVQLRDREALTTLVEMSGPSVGFALDLPAEPLRVALDPAFDLFRTLAPGESPPTLGALFGAERGLILTPSEASPALRDAYQALAQRWAKDSPGWGVASDRDLGALPGDRPVWLLGWENRFLAELKGAAQPFSLDGAQRTLGLPEGVFDGTGLSLGLVATRGEQPPLAWLAADNPEALPSLARKLPHYGKYGYLVFEGSAPDNRIKGQWPAGDSALRVRLDGEAPPLELAPETPLTRVLD